MTAGAVPTTTAPPTRRRFARWNPGLALGVVVAALIGTQLIALALLLAVGGDDAPDWTQGAMIVVADLILLGVIVAVANRGADKLGAATLGIRRSPFWPSVGWMVMTYFAVMVFNVFWILVVGTGGATETGEGTTELTVTTAVFYTLAVALTAPIVEEITFRGYLFPALTRWRGPWIGALVCGVVFGLAHFAVHPPELLPMMAVFGFFACLLFWFTGSLLPCVALHAMNNALVTGTDFGWSWQTPLYMLGCMAVAVLLLMPFARERAPKPA
ncbi:CPBP family intramembrane metalloprotease [Solirubrobacter phytolaccae]|uniref:CPBP family intramembrane metalloprotease n=1 Tax=Solirubrobacter phytolaccae TaxID=1404360 RepID=A0A9X3NG40_9ACTN|nr:CPBP family intramembrane glutamic endopeptidase [Solirubrobacter phytolaccae]MDA0185476.1 CPBP family intramembrane metalloprotease [Solirubrobacter phytolaccae]